MDMQKRVGILRCTTILSEANGKQIFIISLLVFLFWQISSYCILPALSLDGIIYCHITVGSFKGPLFLEFINELLEEMNPFPGPNSVIVMDNCSVHRVPGVRDLIENRCVMNHLTESWRNTNVVLQWNVCWILTSVFTGFQPNWIGLLVHKGPNPYKPAWCATSPWQEKG